MNKPSISALYIVATPIGNPRDITLRAMDTLTSVDVVICEELREGSTLLKKIGVQAKELLALNEHNEPEQTPLLIRRLLMGESMALISDGGTPVFADPGYHLISQAAEYEIRVIPIPGPSSLMAALSLLDFKLEGFVFAGFLSPKNELRRTELEKLKSYRIPVILMDTPYRLGRTLEEVRKVFGAKRQVTLACNLTLSKEKIYRGMISEIQNAVGDRKAEFILIVHA